MSTLFFMKKGGEFLMEQENSFINREIAVVRTQKKLIAFSDKLSMCKRDNYAKIHAESKEGVSSFPSRIGVLIQDYSKGTGEKNNILEANLSPGAIAYIKNQLIEKLSMRNIDYEWKQQRIHEMKIDRNGFAPVQTLCIKRQCLTKKGEPQRNPWIISIENGVARPEKTSTGGTKINGNSYRKTNFAFIMLSEEDMFKLFWKVERYIQLWELAFAIPVIKEAKRAMAN